MIRALAALTGLAALLVWAGRLQDGRGAFAVFLLSTTLLLAISWRFVRAYGNDDPWDVRVMDVMIVALSAIVVLGLLLGTLGWLYLPVLMVVLAGMGLSIRSNSPHPLPFKQPSPPSRDPEGTPPCGGEGCLESDTDARLKLPSPPQGRGAGGEGWPHALLTGLIAFGIAQLVRDRGLLPPVGDAIGYHLPFVAEWLQSGRLVMPVPAAGDPSPPFYPLNSSLWMFWTAAPFDSDVLARFVQAPFFVLLFLAVVRLGLEINLPPTGAITAGLLTLSLPDIIRGLALAENDVILAGLLVAATANLALLWRRPTGWRAVMSAVLLGLAIGTKVLAVPFVAVLGVVWLAIIIYRWRPDGWRRVVTLAAIGAATVILLGGYSYLRNAIVMHNPSYPVQILWRGEEVLPGLYATTREWKESHPFYPFDWRGFFGLGMRGFFGWTVPLFILPGLALAAWRALRERQLGPPLLALWCGLSLAIFWFILPYHFARFLYATLAWSIVVAVWGWLALFRGRAGWLGLLAVPLAAINVAGIPIDSDVWRRLTYLAAAVLIVTATALAVIIAWWMARRLRSQTVGRMIAGMLLLSIVIWPVYGDRYAAQRFDQWGRLSSFLGSQPATWRWLWDLTWNDPATIAVAGTNSTFPLYGPELDNEVLTISHDGRRQEYGWGKQFHPFGEPDHDRWLETVQASDVDYLWITANVSFGEWPVEDEWAAAAPDRFEPVVMEADLHVWRVIGQ